MLDSWVSDSTNCEVLLRSPLTTRYQRDPALQRANSWPPRNLNKFTVMFMAKHEHPCCLGLSTNYTPIPKYTSGVLIAAVVEAIEANKMQLVMVRTASHHYQRSLYVTWRTAISLSDMMPMRFTSYRILDILQNVWKKSGLWDPKYSGYIKHGNVSLVWCSIMHLLNYCSLRGIAKPSIIDVCNNRQ